jgi:hypothetical protein
MSRPDDMDEPDPPDDSKPPEGPARHIVRTPFEMQPPPGMRRPATPPETPPSLEPIPEGEVEARPRGLWGAFSLSVVAQAKSDATRQHSTSLQRAADAAFTSVAALDADQQLELDRRALSLVTSGLAIWRHNREQAPFADATQFRDWLTAADADLRAIASLLAGCPAAPPDHSLHGEVLDSQLVDVAAERLPRPLVLDYWRRLGTTADDPRPGVFVSHASADRHEARAFKVSLTPEVLVVLDADYLRLGDTWWDVIGDAITHCEATLVLVSPASVRSLNVRSEISFAADQRNRTRGRHRLIPVLLAKELEGPLPLPLAGLHALRVEQESGIAGAAMRLKVDLVSGTAGRQV